MPLPQKIAPELVTRLAAEIYRERQREQRTSAEAVVMPEEVPPQLHSVLEQAVAELWIIAQQQASTAHAEVERVTEARLVKVEHALAEAKANQDSAQQALAEAQVQRDAASARVEELERRLADQQRQAESQAEELKEARAQLLEQARALGELDALRRQVEQQQVLVERQRAVGEAE